MKTLLNIPLNQKCRIVGISEKLPDLIKKRLTELGFYTGINVMLILKNNLAKVGLVEIFNGIISLDYFILSCIMVE